MTVTPPIASPDDRAVVAVRAQLRDLRRRLAHLTGSVVSSSDGLLVANDLAPEIEPAGMAALTTSGLALSTRIASTAHGGEFREVVIRGTGGYVVSYSAGGTASLTVLAEPAVNLGRLHLEARPTAHAIARLLAEESPGPL